MSDLNETIYQAAKAHLGTWEWAGEEHNPAVVQMYADAGHPEILQDEVPWCAAFVGSVLAKVGLPNTGSLMARSYSTYGEPVKDIKDWRRGDIVVKKRGADPRFGHVFFLHKYNPITNTVLGLGGNQNNQVNISEYKVSDIVAIRRAVLPRKSLAQSKTTALSTMGMGTSLGGGVLTAFASTTSPQVQMMLIGVFTVLFLACLIIFRDRISSWLNKGNR